MVPTDAASVRFHCVFEREAGDLAAINKGEVLKGRYEK